MTQSYSQIDVCELINSRAVHNISITTVRWRVQVRFDEFVTQCKLIIVCFNALIHEYFKIIFSTAQICFLLVSDWQMFANTCEGALIVWNDNYGRHVRAQSCKQQLILVSSTNGSIVGRNAGSMAIGYH